MMHRKSSTNSDKMSDEEDEPRVKVLQNKVLQKVSPTLILMGEIADEVTIQVIKKSSESTEKVKSEKPDAGPEGATHSVFSRQENKDC